MRLPEVWKIACCPYNQIKSDVQTIFKVLTATQLLNVWWNRQFVALDRRAGQAQLHVLEIRLEHAHLTRQIKAHRRHFFQAGAHLGERGWRYLDRLHIQGQFFDALLLFCGLGLGNCNHLCRR